MNKIVFFIIGIFMTLPLYSQVEDIYFGAGNNDQVTVSSSDNAQLYSGVFTANDHNTITGKGMLADTIEASRFLFQAAFGGNKQLITDVINLGIEAWIDSQFLIPPTYATDTINGIYEDSKKIWILNGNDEANYPSRPNHVHMNYTWWQNTMLADDILRQKMAYALSQILVLSSESDLTSYGVAVANYYDRLIKHSFGNFYDLLYEVTRHPGMGNYLTYFRNKKTDESTNTYPDQNYAREVMQLFTIGLDSLNLDGTPALDTAGNRIPTYDNDDIIEFSKIFTGLASGAVAPYITYTEDPYFNLSFYATAKDSLMAMYDAYHEPGEKYLLNGYVVPDGQTGMEDLEDALMHLFNHPNVGPFISYRLIQRLVKSNPTPAYVESVATIFNNNGAGVRGDLKAVLKAILMHPEARECTWINHPQQGQLREPFLRKTHFINSIGLLDNSLENFWNYKYWFYNETGQHPFHSPTVFNFYVPNYVPNGPIEDANLVAPEFQIHNSRTSIGFSKQVYYWVENLVALRTSGYEGYVITNPDFDSLEEIAKDADALIDYLDIRLTHGKLSTNTREIIKETLNEFGTSGFDIDRRIRLATYLIMISPDYSILK